MLYAEQCANYIFYGDLSNFSPQSYGEVTFTPFVKEFSRPEGKLLVLFYF